MTGTRSPLAASNPRIKHLRRLLGRRGAREEHGAFVVEGPVLVADALEVGAPVRAVFVDAAVLDAPDRPADRWRWLATVPPELLWPVAPGVLHRVLDTATPQPAAAVVDRRVTDLDAVLGAPVPLVAVLAGVADPGNVGTIVRSATAAGGSVVVTEQTADPWSPKAVRASAGAVLRGPVVEAGLTAALERLAAAGLACWIADAGGGTPLEAWPAGGPVALVVGNEARGVPPGVAAVATGRVHVPMAAGSESLNAAVAASVLLFEAARQRRTGPAAPAGTDGRPGGATA